MSGYKDRGPQFGGYYKVDPLEPKKLFGIEWLNSFPCGEGVTFFLFYKDQLDGQGESIDLDVGTADDLPNISLEGLVPSVQQFIAGDLEQGLDMDSIIELRAAVMVPKFLGFTYEELDNPDIAGIAENGTEYTYKAISKCSEER